MFHMIHALGRGYRQAVLRFLIQIRTMHMLRNDFNHMTSENARVRTQHCGYWCFIAIAPNHQGPLLLTWINFNPSMDK